MPHAGAAQVALARAPVEEDDDEHHASERASERVFRAAARMGIDARRDQSHRRTEADGRAGFGGEWKECGVWLTDGHSIVLTLHAGSLAHIKTFFPKLYLSIAATTIEPG